MGIPEIILIIVCVLVVASVFIVWLVRRSRVNAAATAAEIAPTAICVFAPPKRQGVKPKPKNMLPRITLPQIILPGHNYDLIQ